jgi:hypothetical protein
MFFIMKKKRFEVNSRGGVRERTLEVQVEVEEKRRRI